MNGRCARHLNRGLADTWIMAVLPSELLPPPEPGSEKTMLLYTIAPSSICVRNCSEKSQQKSVTRSRPPLRSVDRIC